jgi:hypothetical protein
MARGDFPPRADSSPWFRFLRLIWMGSWGVVDHWGDEVGSRDRAEKEISTGYWGIFEC